MTTKFLAVLLLVTTGLFSSATFGAEKVTLIYEDYFGDYYVGTRHEVEIEFENESVKSLTKMLNVLNPRANADLLIIGYGDQDVLSSYLAGTRDLNSEVLLSKIPALKSLEGRSEPLVFFNWIAKDYSRYASPTAPLHFPLSPWRHLPLIGRQISFF